MVFIQNPCLSHFVYFIYFTFLWTNLYSKLGNNFGVAVKQSFERNLNL